MLDFFKYLLLCVGCFSTCFCGKITALEPISDQDLKTNIVDRAYAIENEIEIRAIIRNFVEMISYLESMGCQFPPIMDFLEACRKVADWEGVKIDDRVFEALKEELQCFLRSGGFDYVSDKPEITLSTKLVAGFLKFMGGTLLVIVPFPAVQAVGATLVVIGVSDMFKHSPCKIKPHSRFLSV